MGNNRKNPLFQLADCGQSVWLDNLTRQKIKGGELRRRIEKEGLRGITSNPAIFNKAIAGSDDYDGEIAELAAKGLGVNETYEKLVIPDIQDACDLLRPVYDETEGLDGFVSLEVSPHLAHDTSGTMTEVRHLFRRVDRPNVLIKIPGTPAGIPAIEEMLYENINVNITLLFSIESYEEVARAYIRALQRRVADGKAVNEVASVASFFLSRIDVLVDQILGDLNARGEGLLGAPRPVELLGKCAIASAKLAYRSFRNIFDGGVWKDLAGRGAKLQRVLWASTSTKNPDYRDVRYVEPLIGRHTVNTMPDETIEAFADHGDVVKDAIEQGVEESIELMADLQRVGVDMKSVTQQLLDEGVQKFIDPFDELMDTLTERVRRLSAGKIAGRASE